MKLLILLSLCVLIGVGAAVATAEWLARRVEIHLACPALPDQSSL